MKEKIYNKDNIKKIYKTIIRVKILLINSKNEITLAFSDNVYHFVGGHVEENEQLNNAVIREVEEETGIKLEKIEYKPFYKITEIFKDYPEKDKHNCYEYYYYVINTDEEPNISNTNYTEEEKLGNFELRNFKINEVEKVLEEALSKGERNKKIGLTMLEAIKVYKELNKKEVK